MQSGGRFKNGFFLLELIIAVMISVLLSTIVLDYVSALIHWNHDVFMRYRIIQELKKASSLTDSKRMPKLYAVSGNGIIKNREKKFAVAAQLPFASIGEVHYFSVRQHEGIWKDSKGNEHILTLISGKCV